MVPPQYIYCYWIWVWAALFIFNIIKQSPLPSSIGALIFTTWAVFLSPWEKKFPLDFSIFIVVFEIFVVAVVAYKLKNPVKGFFRDLYTNIIVFIVYLGYLFTERKSFFDIYFQAVPNQKELGHDLLDYIKKRFQL
jgi:hypothetical protein